MGRGEAQVCYCGHEVDKETASMVQSEYKQMELGFVFAVRLISTIYNASSGGLCCTFLVAQKR